MVKAAQPIAIRTDHIGFQKERTNYVSNATRGKIPPALHKMVRSLDWPIDMTDPNINISVFHNEECKPIDRFDGQPVPPITPRGSDGIDLQAPAGTEVRAVADGRLVYADTREEPDTCLWVYSEGSNILWSYGHLSRVAVPSPLLGQSAWKPAGGPAVNKGSLIGKVLEWRSAGFLSPPPTMLVGIHRERDVAEYYGQGTYHRLHFRSFYVPGGLAALKGIDPGRIDEGRYALEKNIEPMNPLLFLKQLYDLFAAHRNKLQQTLVEKKLSAVQKEDVDLLFGVDALMRECAGLGEAQFGEAWQMLLEPLGHWQNPAAVLALSAAIKHCLVRFPKREKKEKGYWPSNAELVAPLQSVFNASPLPLASVITLGSEIKIYGGANRSISLDAKRDLLVEAIKNEASCSVEERFDAAILWLARADLKPGRDIRDRATEIVCERFEARRFSDDIDFIRTIHRLGLADLAAKETRKIIEAIVDYLDPAGEHPHAFLIMEIAEFVQELAKMKISLGVISPAALDSWISYIGPMVASWGSEFRAGAHGSAFDFGRSLNLLKAEKARRGS